MIHLKGRAEERWVTLRDPAAFEVLVQRYSGLVFATCRRMLKDQSEAEDVTQECFELLAQSVTVKPNAVGSWLYGVATRRCLHRLRSERRRRMREERYSMLLEANTMPEWNDVQEHLDQEIAQLPDSLREPLVAHFIEGKSHAAIARALGVPRRTISHRIERAVDETANGLRRRGIAIGTLSLASMLSVHLAQAAPVPAVLALSLCRIVPSQTGLLPLGAASITTVYTSGGYSMLKISAASIVAMSAILTAMFGVSRLPLTSPADSHVAAAFASTGGTRTDQTRAGSPTPQTLPADVAGAVAVPTAATVVKALSNTLQAQQQQYSLSYTCEERRTSHITSQPNQYSGAPRTLYSEGEIATDGATIAWREWRWGQGGSFESIPREQALYQRLTFDGRETWRYGKDVRVPGMPHGHFAIERGSGEVFQESNGGFPGHFLMGYISLVWFRIDKILAEANVLLRPDSQDVGGVPCHVLDFESRYGRGTIWVDPKHGHAIAAANVNIQTGDVAHGTVRENSRTDLGVRDVKFTNVEGVWFPAAGTFEVCGQWAGGADIETSTRKVVLKDISRKPDMKKALRTDDIDDGASAGYIGIPGWYQWNRGQLVPSREPSAE
jgi:RNA polymerase sigma factor (sigma-70 family)